MDLVYPLKVENFNHDLKFSLRSVVKNFNHFDNVVISGYKPYWLKNVKFIKTDQKSSKSLNAFNNILKACKDENVSEDFILMNDDFLALKKINVEKDLNLCHGNLDDRIERFKNMERSNWRDGFTEIKDLLLKLKSKHFKDYELHVPMIINKANFIKMSELPEVQEFIKKGKYFLYRSLYGNLFYKARPRIIKDVKLKKGVDLSDDFLKGKNWLSVFDEVLENRKYPILFKYLQDTLNAKTIYE